MDIDDNPALDEDHEEVLEELRAIVTDEDIPVSTSTQLAERLDRKRRRVFDDLEDLAVAGLVESAKPGARATVWWPSPHPWRSSDPLMRERQQMPSEPAPREMPDVDRAEPDEPDQEDAGAVEDVEEYLEGRPPKTSHGKRAVLEAVRYLREHGPAPTGDVQAAVFAVEEVGEEYSTERTMWNAIDRYLEDVPGVEKPEYGMWDWSPE